MKIQGTYLGNGNIQVDQIKGHGEKLVQNVKFTGDEPAIGDILNLDTSDIVLGERDSASFTLRDALTTKPAVEQTKLDTE